MAEQSRRLGGVGWGFMHYIYILRSELDGSFYIGSTANIEERVREHNFGRTRYTSRRRPWELVYSEEYSDKFEALRREKQIKKRKSKKYIERLIIRFIRAANKTAGL